MKTLLKKIDLLRTSAFIGGEWLNSRTNKTFSVTNPADGKEIAKVADLGAAETLQAIDAATVALPAWRKKTAKERSQILKKWFELITTHQEDLAILMTCEQGKPLAESRGEIAYGASYIEWFAEEAKRVYGDIIPATANGRKIFVTKEPIGVVAAITPWNFPIAMITRKAAAALAAGCTMVLKPSEETPLSALALAKLGEEAGIPAGVFNVVLTTDPAAVGAELTGSSKVRKISFTGSTEIGKLLFKNSASTIKKLSLELGGNAPFIVFDDADVDSAVIGAMASKFRNSGQTCVCTNRFLVQKNIYAEFSKKLAEATAKLQMGSGLDPKTNQGPLINMAAVEKVESLLADATKKGATVIIGGKRGPSTFFTPTVLTNVTTEMKIVVEEIFGPVASLIQFDTEADAIRIANATPFGLASYFYSTNNSRIWRVTEALECGIVGVNEGLISTEVAPFGGYKESGLGREGSKYGIDDYLQIKYMLLGGLQTEATI